MPRPVQAGQDGRWSLNQAWPVAGVSERQARNAVAAGVIPRAELSPADVFALRVSAHFLDLTASSELAPLTKARNQTAAELARKTFRENGPRNWTLVLTSLDAKLAENDQMLSALLKGYSSVPCLVLPIGEWANAMRSDLAA